MTIIKFDEFSFVIHRVLGDAGPIDPGSGIQTIDIVRSITKHEPDLSTIKYQLHQIERDLGYWEQRVTADVLMAKPHQLELLDQDVKQDIDSITEAIFVLHARILNATQMAETCQGSALLSRKSALDRHAFPTEFFASETPLSAAISAIVTRKQSGLPELEMLKTLVQCLRNTYLHYTEIAKETPVSESIDRSLYYNCFANEVTFSAALRWLDVSDFESTFKMTEYLQRLVKKRATGTCEWIFTNPAYLHWYGRKDRLQLSRAQILWVCGPAECGKSILAANIINTLQADVEAKVVYFFASAHAISANVDPMIIARCWLARIATQNSVALQQLCKMLAESKNSPNWQKASDTMVWRLLRLLFCRIPHWILVIDGLNEYQLSDQMRFCVELYKAVAGTTTRVLFVSRRQTETDEQISSSSSSSKAGGGLALDIMRYDIQRNDILDDQRQLATEIVNAAIHKRNDIIHRDATVVNLVDEITGANSELSFLWLYCLSKELRSSRTITYCRKVVARMPRTIAEYFAFQWKIIGKMEQGRKTKAYEIFHWLLFGYIPFNLHQLIEALRTSPTKDMCMLDLSRDDGSYLNELRVLCKSLVEVDETHTIRFVHPSAKDFVCQNLGISNSCQTALAQKNMALRCLNYLNSLVHVSGMPSTCESSTYGLAVITEKWLSKEFKKRPLADLRDNPIWKKRFNQHFDFANYAQVYWYKHVIAAGTEHFDALLEDIRQYLEPAQDRWPWWEIDLDTNDDDGDIAEYLMSYWSARIRTSWLDILFQPDHMHNCSIKFFDLITAQDIKNMNTSFDKLFAYCIQHGNVDKVRRLIEMGVSVQRVHRSDAPLQIASRFGYETIVDILLKHNADLCHSKCNRDCNLESARHPITALQYAIEHQHPRIARSILRNFQPKHCKSNYLEKDGLALLIAKASLKSHNTEWYKVLLLDLIRDGRVPTKFMGQAGPGKFNFVLPDYSSDPSREYPMPASAQLQGEPMHPLKFVLRITISTDSDATLEQTSLPRVRNDPDLTISEIFELCPHAQLDIVPLKTELQDCDAIMMSLLCTFFNSSRDYKLRMTEAEFFDIWQSRQDKSGTFQIILQALRAAPLGFYQARCTYQMPKNLLVWAATSHGHNNVLVDLLEGGYLTLLAKFHDECECGATSLGFILRLLTEAARGNQVQTVKHLLAATIVVSDPKGFSHDKPGGSQYQVGPPKAQSQDDETTTDPIQSGQVTALLSEEQKLALLQSASDSQGRPFSDTWLALVATGHFGQILREKFGLDRVLVAAVTSDLVKLSSHIDEIQRDHTSQLPCTKNGWSALHVACASGQAEALRLLLDCDRYDPNTKTAEGLNLLGMATMSCDVDTTSVLLQCPRVQPCISLDRTGVEYELSSFFSNIWDEQSRKRLFEAKSDQPLTFTLASKTNDDDDDDDDDALYDTPAYKDQDGVPDDMAIECSTDCETHNAEGIDTRALKHVTVEKFARDIGLMSSRYDTEGMKLVVAKDSHPKTGQASSKPVDITGILSTSLRQRALDWAIRVATSQGSAAAVKSMLKSQLIIIESELSKSQSPHARKQPDTAKNFSMAVESAASTGQYHIVRILLTEYYSIMCQPGYETPLYDCQRLWAIACERRHLSLKLEVIKWMNFKGQEREDDGYI